MSSPAYKGNLSVGGSALEKSKLQLRRPTPDSDVLASSDEDREHVPAVVRPPAGGHPGGRRPSTGWLQDIQPNRKFSLPSVSFAASQPTTPALELPSQSRPGTSAFPWNTSSFTSSQGSSRLKEVLPSPTSAHFNSEKPLHSPTTAEGDDGIGFLLNQHNPVRKAVRSQSYSIGQGDIENSPVGQFSARLRSSAGVRHRPSKPSLLGESALGLSQLREDEVDEIESNGSEHGIRLPPGYWEREQKQALLKQAAMENARSRNRAPSTSSPVNQQPQPPQMPQRRKTTAGLRGVPYANTTDYAIEEIEDSDPATNTHAASSFLRRFSEQVSVISREPEVETLDNNNNKKPQWATQNIRHMGMDALGRRHSFAHVGSFNPGLPHSTLSNTQEEDESLMSPRQTVQSPDESDQFDAAAYFAGYGPASRAINASAISAAHPDPAAPNTTLNTGNPYAVPPVLGRPGRRLFVVTFKCSRADIYYLYDNTGLEVRCGDLVITEGDRGCDLGQVAHADVTHEDAKKFKAQLNEEHFRWLVMFSQYSQAGSQNEPSMLGALARANGPNQPQMTGIIGNADQEAKPKMIKRLAQQHEIMGLRDKEGQEAKAKRLGAQKAADHKLPMEILDAEYQADYHKLTYFYFAESYVNFNELVTDLFKQYKVRIWMSAVNPASVVNPAGLMQIPPPSAIGPGAILNQATGNAPLPVGPGFGGGNRRSNEQYGRNRGNAPQVQGQGSAHGQGQAQGAGNYDDGYYAFSHQLPAYPPQGAYNMSSWTHGQQQLPQQLPQNMYDRYGAYPGGYPNASVAGSPMNYGAFYPPSSTYGSSAYTRMYAGTNTYNSTANANPNATGNANSNVAANAAYGQNTTHGAGNNAPAGNGSTATPEVPFNGPVDHMLITAMHNMNFAPK